MYRDYPISPDLFHWESQSTTSIDSPTGQRYLGGRANTLLFTHSAESMVWGTAAYTLLGDARYVQHSGSRPIAITWRLNRPMPTDLYTEAKVVS